MTIEKQKKKRLVLTENYWLKSGNILGIFWDFFEIFLEIFFENEGVSGFQTTTTDHNHDGDTPET